MNLFETFLVVRDHFSSHEESSVKSWERCSIGKKCVDCIESFFLNITDLSINNLSKLFNKLYVIQGECVS